MAHDGLVAIAGQAPPPLVVDGEVGPPHEHMFAYAPAARLSASYGAPTKICVEP